MAQMKVSSIHTEPSGSWDHVHITRLRYLQVGFGSEIEVSTVRMIELLRGVSNNIAYVSDKEGNALVQVVNGPITYLRTIRDGRYTDNLLALPRF